MTVAIAFHGGTYGTYLEWCLTTLTSDIPVRSPVNGKGASHNFVGLHLEDFDGWQKFVASNTQAPFVRFHPKTKKDHKLSSNLDHVCKNAQSVIYLYPDADSILLSVNNRITKTFDDWWATELLNNIDVAQVYQNWPITSDTPLDQIPLWIQREFLSYYLMPAWFDQVEWNHLTNWSHPNACIVTVSELLFDFETTMHKLQNHCKLDYVKHVSELLPYHAENLNQQTHLGQDQICKRIVNSITNRTDFDWETLSFGSEVWIQWELRNCGLEIKCNGLDKFPTSSVQLRELLYPI